MNVPVSSTRAFAMIVANSFTTRESPLNNSLITYFLSNVMAPALSSREPAKNAYDASLIAVVPTVAFFPVLTATHPSNEAPDPSPYTLFTVPP